VGLLHPEQRLLDVELGLLDTLGAREVGTCGVEGALGIAGLIRGARRLALRAVHPELGFDHRAVVGRILPGPVELGLRISCGD
jgi:hypothetical protein